MSPEDLALMRRIDELHLERPFAGSRMLRDFLEREGVAVGRRHVATLMRRMGIEAIYRRRNSSKPAPGHKIYPQLLRGAKVEARPNQVWATDITYIPMARGFVYLVAVVDWFTRRVLSHRVSITMDAAFCVEALEEAIGKYGKPEIFNTDQGSQFTGEAFTGVLLANGIAISMDGKGSWRDNVFVERLWKSVKYEEVYLKAYDTVAEARSSLGRYLDFYNRQRPHSSLDRRTPDEAYFGSDANRGGGMKASFSRIGVGPPVGLRSPFVPPLCGRDSKPGRTPLIVRGNLSRQPEPALSRRLLALASAR